MFANIDIVNTVVQFKFYSLISKYMLLALVNIRKYTDAHKDPVCGHVCVCASQEKRVKLQVTVS